MGNQPEDKFIYTESLRLHYLEWGSDQTRTMVPLHGIGDNAHIGDHFSRATADRWKIIALDQRGQGLSDWAVPLIPQGRFTEVQMATHPLHTGNPLGFQWAVVDFIDELHGIFS